MRNLLALAAFALVSPACPAPPVSAEGEGDVGEGEGDSGEGEGESGEGEGEVVVDLGCLDNNPSLSANERALIEMPADSWLEVPDTHFFDFCQPRGLGSPPDGAFRCASIIEAWGGGVFDHAARKMILWGGGHGDYAGNEVYAFDPATFAWELVRGPTLVDDSQLSVDPYFDGSPASRHSYDGFAFIEDQGVWFHFGGSRAGDGSSTNTAWTFDTATATFTRLADAPSSSGGHFYTGTAYDPVTRQVVTRTQDGVFTYGFSDNTWTRRSDFGFPPYFPNFSTGNYRRAVMLVDDRVFIALGGVTGDGAPDVVAFNVDTFEDKSADYQGSGDLSVVEASGPGVDYDGAAHAIVAWAGGAPARWNLDTLVWDRGSADGAPAEAVENGTYGRFRYLDYLNVFILVNRANDNVYFYKHTGGCGPG